MSAQNLPEGTPAQQRSEVDVFPFFRSLTLVAMELEPQISDLPDGQLVNIVATVNYVGPGFAALTSSIHRLNFMTDMRITSATHVTLFGMKKMKVVDQHWLLRTNETVIVEHQVRDVQTIPVVAEVCSGISAVSTGYEACGARVDMHCDNNPVFTDWLQAHGKRVIQGDLADPRTVSNLSQHCGGILSGGISCQPWSKLGDEQHLNDPRARSLPGMLQAVHLLQISLAIMECTEAVHQSVDAQFMLRQFAVATGMVVQQKVLPLHSIWPAKRTRWWATLSRPCLELQPIPDVPALAFEPSLIHLFPHFMELTDRDLSQLKLDDDEMDQFLSTPRGMYEHQVKQLKPLPTATHSWGSQLRGCECGCRQKGFSSHRIRTKGLYGQLLPLAETCTKDGEVVQRMRHLHASEVALANGLHPKYLGLHEKSARLALAAVGQMASPFHSAWILSNAMQDMHKAGLLAGPITPPIQIMKQHAKMLLHQRDELLGIQSYTESMQRLHAAIEFWGQPDAAQRISAIPFASPPTAMPGSEHHQSQVAYVPRTQLTEVGHEQPSMPHPRDPQTMLPQEVKVEDPMPTQVESDQSDSLAIQPGVKAGTDHSGCIPNQATSVPPNALGFQHPVYPVCDEKNQQNSQRLGRKDPQSFKQPANQAQGLEQNDQQPAVETQKLPLPMSLHAMPQRTAVTEGPALPHVTPDANLAVEFSLSMLTPGKPVEVASDQSTVASVPPNALGFQHPVYPVCDDKIQQNSQRLGRKDPQRDQNSFKQPANQAQGLEQNDQQPAVETQKLHQPMVLQAMPLGTPVPAGPPPQCSCPCQSCSHQESQWKLHPINPQVPFSRSKFMVTVGLPQLQLRFCSPHRLFKKNMFSDNLSIRIKNHPF